MTNATYDFLAAGNARKKEKRELEEKQKRELKEDMSVGMLRQRRNLMGICLMLVAYSVSGAQLKEISLLGTKITVAYPTLLIGCLWAVCLYFLYRCYVYSVRERGFEAALIPWRDWVVNYFEKNANELAKEKGFKIIKGSELDKEHVTESESVHGTFVSKYYAVGIRTGGQIPEQKEISLELGKDLDERISRKWLSYHMQFREQLDIMGDEEEIFPPIKMKRSALKIGFSKVWIGVILRRREFSDYMFPFLLFILTVLACVLSTLLNHPEWFESIKPFMNWYLGFEKGVPYY